MTLTVNRIELGILLRKRGILVPRRNIEIVIETIIEMAKADIKKIVEKHNINDLFNKEEAMKISQEIETIASYSNGCLGIFSNPSSISDTWIEENLGRILLTLSDFLEIEEITKAEERKLNKVFVLALLNKVTTNYYVDMSYSYKNYFLTFMSQMTYANIFTDYRYLKSNTAIRGHLELYSRAKNADYFNPDFRKNIYSRFFELAITNNIPVDKKTAEEEFKALINAFEKDEFSDNPIIL